MKFTIITRMALSAGLSGMIGCMGSSKTAGVNSASTYAEQPYNFRLSLTDAPNDDLKAVMVNVKYAELRVAGGGRQARLITARDMGAVNLLDLQNGVTLPMADLDLPAGVEITQIRLVLAADGNYIIKSGGERCDLKTPSEQKTGIKILIHQGVDIEPGYSYSMVVDFDAKKSVVLTGNGGCLLKPVLKLKSAARVVIDESPETPENPETPGGGEDVIIPGDSSSGAGTDTSTDAGTDSNTGGGTADTPGTSQDSDDGSGFDSGTDTSVPEVPADQMDEYFQASDL